MDDLDESLLSDLQELIDLIASIGKDPDGGMTRLLYTKEWAETQNTVKKAMEDYGLIAHFDEIGNLFGRVEGEYANETILTGSHVDTVRNGGKLDGQLGIAAGVIAIGYLRKKYGKPLKSLEVVSFAEEEGSRFPIAFWGSKSFFGMGRKETVINLTDPDGVNFADAMHECGFNFKVDEEEMRDDIEAFVELHIEQGNVLEIEKKQIGVVTGIVGQRRFTIEVTGEPNHAGTTPMNYRKDALVATAQMINEITVRAKKHGDPLVATVGSLDVKPNVVNVVPGKTLFTLDIRHTDQDFLSDFSDEVKEILNRVATDNNVEISINMWMNVAPVSMDKELISLFEDECKKSGFNYKVMHSGAGHDSQIAAPKVKTAMFFVPSRGGISHHPDEFTEAEDLKHGLLALIHILHKLAY